MIITIMIIIIIMMIIIIMIIIIYKARVALALLTTKDVR